MTESLDSFFTAKHKKLDRIARTAKILSWLAIVLYLLLTIAKIWENIIVQGKITLIELLRVAPETAIRSWLSVIDTAFVGIVVWLVLKSVSVGLNMIIETDLNYRDKLQGGNNDK